MKRLLYSEFATADLKGILEYIAHDKPLASRAFVDGIIDTCHAIAENPEIGTRRGDLAPMLRLFTYRGYGIYYRNLDSEVMIERVLHPSLDVRRQSFGET
jgi:plasmid stabilization system protein ParE